MSRKNILGRVEFLIETKTKKGIMRSQGEQKSFRTKSKKLKQLQWKLLAAKKSTMGELSQKKTFRDRQQTSNIFETEYL